MLGCLQIGKVGSVLPLPRVSRHLLLLLLSMAVVLRVCGIDVGIIGGASDIVNAGGIVENAVAITAMVISVGTDGAGITATGVAIGSIGIVGIIVKIAVGLGGSKVMLKLGVACMKSMGKIVSTLESGKMVLSQLWSQLLLQTESMTLHNQRIPRQSPTKPTPKPSYSHIVQTTLRLCDPGKLSPALSYVLSHDLSHDLPACNPGKISYDLPRDWLSIQSHATT